MLFRKTSVNGHILFRNKPDKAAAIPLLIALGFLLLFYIPMFQFYIEDGLLEDSLDTFSDFLTLLIFIGLPSYILFTIFSTIYWDILGEEVVYYSESSIYISQRKVVNKYSVIPWDAVTNISPYDEPLLLALIPTHDPTICITYKKSNGLTRKVRLGYHLSPKQRENIIDLLQELLVENFA